MHGTSCHILSYIVILKMYAENNFNRLRVKDIRLIEDCSYRTALRRMKELKGNAKFVTVGDYKEKFYKQKEN